MADVTIDASYSTTTLRGRRAVVFATDLVGYWFYNDSDGTFGYSKTTDGGATWGPQVEVASATTHVSFDTWFDQWTPGDTGTLVHMWYFNSTDDNVVWRSLDTNGDTLGTEQVVFAGASAVAGRGAIVSGTRTRSGYLYCAYDIDAGVEKGFHRSTDGGATWSANLDATFIEATLDEALLFPASNTGDNDDCWAVYLDASATELTLKMWDSSAGSASESASIQTFVPDSSTGGYSGSVRHSDGHLILAAATALGSATGDHLVWDINGTGSITAKTNITTDIANHYFPQVFIDQITDSIYVAYNGKRDDSEVIDTATKVYYTKSTDGGTTWSAGDTAYMEGAAAQIVQTWAPPSGYRFYVSWRNSSSLALEGNFVNSVVTVSAVVTGTATASITEADIVAGGKTIIIRLTDDTWIA